MVHTPAGTQVVIRTRRRGDRAELSVEDNGPGILAQYREAIFGRFYRVDGGMASGSGLGLAIAREIAKLMGGAVRLDSAGEPTIFTLDLPVEVAPDRPPGEPRAFSRENDERELEHTPPA
jgi:signal transduction histidine kinase